MISDFTYTRWSYAVLLWEIATLGSIYAIIIIIIIIIIITFFETQYMFNYNFTWLQQKVVVTCLYYLF